MSHRWYPLRKRAYLNILKILPPKKWKFSDKNSDTFLISAQNIDCGYSLEPPSIIDCGYSLAPPRRGGSNVYPQSMFLSWNKKKKCIPCKHEFYYMKVGFKGIKIIWAYFRDDVVLMSTQNIWAAPRESVSSGICKPKKQIYSFV